MKDIVIIGAGGHGRVVLDIIRSAGTYRPAGFIDANPLLWGQRIDGLTVLGDLSVLKTPKIKGRYGAIVAIGDNAVRRDYAQRVSQLDLTLVNAIHPSANVASSCTIGENIVIASGCVVCAHCQIGDSVILNTACVVDHETVVGQGAHICPGSRLAGRVLVGSGAFVGIGATIIQNVRIGSEAVVGAGAVVIRDVLPGSTVVGVPARTIKTADGQPLRFPAELEEQLQEATVFQA